MKKLEQGMLEHDRLTSLKTYLEANKLFMRDDP